MILRPERSSSVSGVSKIYAARHKLNLVFDMFVKAGRWRITVISVVFFLMTAALSRLFPEYDSTGVGLLISKCLAPLMHGLDKGGGVY